MDSISPSPFHVCCSRINFDFYAEMERQFTIFINNKWLPEVGNLADHLIRMPTSTLSIYLIYIYIYISPPDSPSSTHKPMHKYCVREMQIKYKDPASGEYEYLMECGWRDSASLPIAGWFIEIVMEWMMRFISPKRAKRIDGASLSENNSKCISCDNYRQLSRHAVNLGGTLFIIYVLF